MSVLASPEYVNAGSRVTWTGQIEYHLSLSIWDTSGLLAAVSSTLANSFNLVVEKVDNNLSFFTGTGSVTLYLRTTIDRGDGDTDDGLTDILNNVNDSFKTNGSSLTASALNNYQPANTDGTAGGVVNTGTPQATVAQQNAQAAANAGAGRSTGGIFDGLSNWWTSTVNQVEAGSVGFIVGGLAVVGVIIYLSVRKASPV